MSSREFVYSTDPDWCPKCRKLPCDCPGPKRAGASPGKQAAKLRLERSGRHGKSVTVVFNLTLDEAALKEMLRALQRACGTGGTIKDGTIEIQGDHRDRIESLLRGMGHSVKRAGG